MHHFHKINHLLRGFKLKIIAIIVIGLALYVLLRETFDIVDVDGRRFLLRDGRVYFVDRKGRETTLVEKNREKTFSGDEQSLLRPLQERLVFDISLKKKLKINKQKGVRSTEFDHIKASRTDPSTTRRSSLKPKGRKTMNLPDEKVTVQVSEIRSVRKNGKSMIIALSKAHANQSHHIQLASTFDHVEYTGSVNKHFNSGNSKDLYQKYLTQPPGKYECYDWDYNFADYTLVYRPTKKFQNEPCSYPHDEKVRKIITPTREVIWKGCTRHTTPCPEPPYFDFDRNVRRNIPPCCRAHFLEMLQNFDTAVTKRNVTYTLFAGSVMGWFRNQKLVPYDGDLDVLIDGNIFQTQTWYDIFDELTKTYGYTYTRLEDYKVKLRYSKVNYLAIDIWPYYNIKLRTQYGELAPGENVTFIFHSHYTAIRQDLMFPPKRTTIDGVTCNVPRDPIEYLNKNYGPSPETWLPEMTCKKVVEGACAA